MKPAADTAITRYLKTLDNSKLITHAKNVIRAETIATLEVIHTLYEIESRKLYLDQGFGSLFEMCTAEFGYTHGTATRRIDSMRLMYELPEVEEKILQGELNISVVSQVQSFLQQERKANKHYTSSEKSELLENMIGKSTREVERELAKISPKSATPEKVRWISDELVELKISIDAETLHNLEKLKDLLSHKEPGMSFESVIKQLSEIALDKLDPERKERRISLKKAKKFQSTDRQAPKKTGPTNSESKSLPALELKPEQEARSKPKKKNRYIRAATRRKVWIRDQGQCSYVDHRSGRRCGSRHLLQPDHVFPYALGGDHKTENLRLLCAAHNQHRARKTWPQEPWRKRIT